MATRTNDEHGWGRRPGARAVWVVAGVVACGLFLPQLAFAGEGGDSSKGLLSAPAEKKPATKPNAPAAPAMTCTLLTVEAPRGGRLEVQGEGFGKAPLVRIAGRVTRMIDRNGNKIAVQIPPDSDGGAVTVQAGKLQVQCGTLIIIGKNG